MSNIQDAINDINYNYNFPYLGNLIKLIQSKYTFSKDEIIKSVKCDINSQLMQSRKTPKILGHITSLAVNELMQLDIFDMQRYKSDNKIGDITYPYILVLIDVLSRYCYVEPLQDKTQVPVFETFKKLVDKVMAKQKPNKILEDFSVFYLDKGQKKDYLNPENGLISGAFPSKTEKSQKI